MTVLQGKGYYKVTALKKDLRKGEARLLLAWAFISFLPVLSVPLVPTRNPATSERSFTGVSEEGKTRERAQTDSDGHGQQADRN